MAFYAVVEHRGSTHWYSDLLETPFQSEEDAHTAAEQVVDERDAVRNVYVFPADDLQAARTELIRRGLDWRWQPSQGVWPGTTVRHHRWQRRSATWDHDHCEFCYRTFMDCTDPTINPELFTSGKLADRGYGNVAFDEWPDDYYWVCEECFRDFAPFFHWTVIEGDDTGSPS